jgi:ABC-type taurine transport system ATPase subunit
MAEGRLPKIALKWMPKQMRARGRPKKNRIEGIKNAMHERKLNEGQWEDRKQWSLSGGQRRKTF